MIGQQPTNTNPLRKLRAARHAKAKSAPDFRFYSLYDKVYRRDVLEAAWLQCRANGGASGVDGQSFEDIKQYGMGRWLDELTEELHLHPGVSVRASARHSSGPSVAAAEIRAAWAGIEPISRQSSGARAWTAEPQSLSPPLLVGEVMILVREPDAGNPPARVR